MLFDKRSKRTGLPPGARKTGGQPSLETKLYHIDFDMMLKGPVIKRGKRQVRQLGVTVDGSTRLVTSGDTVDEETYRALLALGAIRPPSSPRPESARPFGVAPPETPKLEEE